MITYKDFGGEQAEQTNKLIAYYNDCQQPYVEQMLDGKCKGYGQRHDWKLRGIIPRHKNIVKPIVDKSALLFNKLPQLLVWSEDSDQPITDNVLDELMFNSDWGDFFTNVDIFTRLLKTTIVLVQKYVSPLNTQTVGTIYKYNKYAGDGLIWQLLHRGNCVYNTDVTGQTITELGFITEIHADYWTYRVITADMITDVKVENDKETIIDTTQNPDKIVPAVIFNDITKPFNKKWNDLPYSMIVAQEMYNLFLTDSEFNAAFQLNPTLVTTGKILNSTAPSAPVVDRSDLPPGAAPYLAPSATDSRARSDKVGGLGSTVYVSLDDNGSAPKFEYVAPQTSIQPLKEMYADLIDSVARDWSVSIKEGNGSASSGFQLVVKEIDNLNLREQRMAAVQHAFRKLHIILQILYPELISGQLLIEFAAPSLPIDEKAQEDLWTEKINNNRASVIDYYMAVYNLTEDEAIEKFKKVKLYNELINSSSTDSQTSETATVSEDTTQLS